MPYHDFDFFIEKSDSGRYAWKAVASTTDVDNYNDQTTEELFRHWLKRAAREEKSEDWLPPLTAPYLSVAHYPSGGGELSAGVTTWMGIQDGKFVARGVISDNDVGHAVIENYSPEKNIRISAGWWDIEHHHDNYVFRRRSMHDVCPVCQKGEPKKYVDGQLVHFALTTVPVNEKTEFVLEEKSMKKKKTKLEDAAEIVGADIAASIAAAAAHASVSLSDTDNDFLDALVVRAQTKTIDGEEFQPGDFLVVEDEEKPSTWHLPVKRNGKPDHRLMGAAKAALTVGYRGQKYQGAQKEEALKKLKALYEAEKMTWKSEAIMEDQNQLDKVVEDVDVPVDQQPEADAKVDADIELSDIDDLLGEDEESHVVFAAVGMGDELDAVLKSDASRTEKLAEIDRIVGKFAMELRSEVEENTPIDPVAKLEEKIAETQDGIATVAKSMAAVLDRIEVLAQKVEDITAATETAPPAPVQRSMTAPVQVQQPAQQHPVAQMNPETGRASLRDIIYRSVGIQ